MSIFKDFEEFETLVKKVYDSNGLILIPAFSGLLAPYWMPEFRL